MQAYLLSLLITALLIATVNLLSPDGERTGISKHVRLVAVLVWITVLIAPLSHLKDDFREWLDGLNEALNENSSSETLPDVNDYLDEASRNYFCDLLTHALEERFSVKTGDVACRVDWQLQDGTATPVRVTVALSNSAIWKNTYEIEAFVQELLGCECTTVIE